jgi:DNA-binding YbaB/EbfC family protein
MTQPFDLGGLTDMLGGFQQQLDAAKSEAARLEATGEAGGGAVRVTANGANQILSVRIAPSALGDAELLEDLIRAASNEALRKAQAGAAASLEKLTANLLPPGLFGT